MRRGGASRPAGKVAAKSPRALERAWPRARLGRVCFTGRRERPSAHTYEDLVVRMAHRTPLPSWSYHVSVVTTLPVTVLSVFDTWLWWPGSSGQGSAVLAVSSHSGASDANGLQEGRAGKGSGGRWARARVARSPEEQKCSAQCSHPRPLSVAE